MRRVLPTAVLLVFAATAAIAQAPSLINFQGQVDSAGVPFTGSRAMVFRIYDAETGGAVLHTENQNVSVVNGQFAVLVGSVTPIPVSVFQSAGPRFLGVTIGGSELTPRYRFGSTGYSLRAATADAVAAGAVTAAGIASNQVVKSVNSLKDDVTLAAGSNVTIVPTGNTLTISAAGGGGGGGTVTQVNTGAGLTGGPITTTGTLSVATGGVTSQMIADQTISTIDIQNDAITSAKIFDGEVQTADLANNAVTSAKIADATIVTGDMADNAVTSAKILNESGLSSSTRNGFGFDGGNIVYVQDSVDITIPSAGHVLVFASGYLNLFHTTGTLTQLQLFLNKVRAGGGFGDPGSQILTVPAVLPTATYQNPYTSYRLFVEAAAGSQRYYLNIRYASGASTSTNMFQAHLTALFIPTLYGTTTAGQDRVPGPPSGDSTRP